MRRCEAPRSRLSSWPCGRSTGGSAAAKDIGLGDIKLAAVAGVWLDWHMMPIAIDIAAAAALAVYVTRQLALGRIIRPTGRLPFGLFLAAAIWIGWLLDRWLMTL